MAPAEGTPGGPQCRTRPLTGVAVPVTWALAISIPHPLTHPVAHRGRAGMTPHHNQHGSDT
jgi:hypothetical protein